VNESSSLDLASGAFERSARIEKGKREGGERKVLPVSTSPQTKSGRGRLTIVMRVRGLLLIMRRVAKGTGRSRIIQAPSFMKKLQTSKTRGARKHRAAN